MKGTKATLQQLMSLLPKTDLQYQMIADKLGLEILQCGIDYFNEADEADAAHKAMKLQKYAKGIVVGQMAKDRCNENVNTLQKIIDNMPPPEVYSEDRAIHEELRKYCLLPDKICYAVTLLNNTKPHLQAIKRKLGTTNDYYLKISTRIVGNALSNVIAEVNEAQSIFNGDKDDSILFSGYLPLLKTALREAWKATMIMDGFDMEYDFKSKKYNENRSILKELCEQLGVSTSTFKPTFSQANRARQVNNSSFATTSRAIPNRQQATINNNNSSNYVETGWGCLLWFVVISTFIILSSFFIFN